MPYPDGSQRQSPSSQIQVAQWQPTMGYYLDSLRQMTPSQLFDVIDEAKKLLEKGPDRCPTQAK